MTNQGDRQADARSSTGTSLTYEGDTLAYFDSQSVPAGDYNGRLLAWINQTLGTSYTEINGAKTALANNVSIPTWDGLNLFGSASTQIQLSNASLLAGSAQGTAIGTLSVTGGTGTYTFTLTDSATNKVQVAGTNGVNLQAGSASASAGSFNITVHADNGAGSVLNRTFLITATGSAALKFNAASNSQYMPLLEDI